MLDYNVRFNKNMHLEISKDENIILMLNLDKKNLLKTKNGHVFFVVSTVDFFYPYDKEDGRMSFFFHNKDVIDNFYFPNLYFISTYSICVLCCVYTQEGLLDSYV